MSADDDQIADADTFFAPAARASGEQLKDQVAFVSGNSVVNDLMAAVHGMLAVLNEQRQILAVNNVLASVLGVEVDRLVGLRPGEAIECIHSQEGPGGCGTGETCSTCGAVVAMLSSLRTNEATEKDCAILAVKEDKPVDLFFRVRSCPITLAGERLLLLFLRDISVERQRAVLEQLFFHDVSNLVENLLYTTQQMGSPTEGDFQELAGQAIDLTSRLAHEVRIQRALSRGPGHYALSMREVSLKRIVLALAQTVGNHPVAEGKTLCLASELQEIRVATDPFLVERVLRNMLINALEATDEGGEARWSMEEADGGVVFLAWNRQCIPERVARRVFQRNFSTKDGAGRGQGTYAMRLLGETYLGGKVSFTSSEEQGTLFRFWLPRQPAARRG